MWFGHTFSGSSQVRDAEYYTSDSMPHRPTSIFFLPPHSISLIISGPTNVVCRNIFLRTESEVVEVSNFGHCHRCPTQGSGLVSISKTPPSGAVRHPNLMPTVPSSLNLNSRRSCVTFTDQVTLYAING